jgi:hypothetical protein
MYKGKRLKKLPHPKISEVAIINSHFGISCLLYSVRDPTHFHETRRQSLTIFTIDDEGLFLKYVGFYEAGKYGVDVDMSSYKRKLVMDREDFL